MKGRCIRRVIVVLLIASIALLFGFETSMVWKIPTLVYQDTKLVESRQITELEHRIKQLEQKVSTPSCVNLMQTPPFRDGALLTRPTTGVSWVPRADHSRQLELSVCSLHRYTASEAKQCLSGKHINFIGDSLMRYQFLSLAWFIHKGSYPPHFGRTRGNPCTHSQNDGTESCSKDDEPNVCIEGDWNRGPANPNDTEAWTMFMRSLGSRLFAGQMESSAIRNSRMGKSLAPENYLYASNSSDVDGSSVVLSFSGEFGWGESPSPIKGFHFTGCVYNGTCDYSEELAEQRIQRVIRDDYDFSEPLEVALGADGALRRQLPPVNISIYNRGLWGLLSKDRATKLMPLFYNFSGQSQGRCYFQSTTGRLDEKRLSVERGQVRISAAMAGCGYLDYSHILTEFNSLIFLHPRPPLQEYGSVGAERQFVYWDSLHFMPWVYEELNNLLLNILCNYRGITQVP